MLHRLSYINLVFAIIYLLVFLRSGTLNSTAGIFVVIVFNWLAIRSYQIENYKWKFWHFIAGLWSLYYAGFVLYGAVNVLTIAIEYEFLSNDSRTFLALSFTFSIAVLAHLVVYFSKNLKGK